MGGCSQQEQPAPPAPIAPSGGSGLRKRASSSFIKSCRLVGRQESGRGAKQISDSNHSSNKKQMRAAHCKSSGYESCSNGERDSLDSKETTGGTSSSPSQVSSQVLGDKARYMQQQMSLAGTGYSLVPIRRHGSINLHTSFI